MRPNPMEPSRRRGDGNRVRRFSASSPPFTLCPCRGKELTTDWTLGRGVGLLAEMQGNDKANQVPEEPENLA